MIKSEFIRRANANGNNSGWTYFGGVLLSFILGSVLGAIPLIIVMFSNGNFSMSNMDSATGLGLSNNAYLMLMLNTFVISTVILWIYIKSVHRRSFKSLITAADKINWRKFIFSFFVWLILAANLELFNYISNPDNYILQFDFAKFIPLFFISLTFLLVQTSFEELLFRGYAMQWIGKYTSYKIVPLFVTSVIFGLVHGANSEVEQFGNVILLDYIAVGLALGTITLLSDSLEMALGFHFANNLFACLFVTFDSSTLQTDAIFRLQEMHHDWVSQVILLSCLIIYLLIMHRRFKLQPLSTLWKK